MFQVKNNHKNYKKWLKKRKNRKQELRKRLKKKCRKILHQRKIWSKSRSHLTFSNSKLLPKNSKKMKILMVISISSIRWAISELEIMDLTNVHGLRQNSKLEGLWLLSVQQHLSLRLFKLSKSWNMLLDQNFGEMPL